MKPHICILTTAHPLDDVRVHSKIAASFLDHGFHVSWVGPDISFYSTCGYRDGRISYHLTPPFGSRLGRLTSASRSRRRARTVTKVDWYYCPDPDSAQVAVKLARASGASVLFDIHEVFHGALIDRWLLGRRARWVRSLVRGRIARTTRRSDLVIGVCAPVLRPYVGRHQPQLVVRNCAPGWFLRDAHLTSTQVPAGDRTTFMHGKALPNNGSQAVLEALARLGPQQAAACVILFPRSQPSAPLYMTDLSARLDALQVRESVCLHPAVAHEDMPAVMARCHVGMVAYGRGLGEDSLPNRLFEYMASGVAILAPSYAHEIKRIVENENIGVTVDFEEPDAIAAAMRWFIDNPEETKAMGERARMAFRRRHNWESEFQLLIAAMDTYRRRPNK